MLEAIGALITALAARPEILGIVSLAWSMVVMTRRKAPYARSGKSTPQFETVIRAHQWGIALLGLVLILREIGKVAVLIYR